MDQKNIRNFCIIAHIDHGKSTLADRLLELTNTVEKRKMKEQVLDSMDLERERGITIKLQPVRMNYKDHQLNLIDTPGHVDFSYEVSRSLAACEGAILVIDASQGIQAQTLANVYLAMEHDLEIIPVINKIDLPNAQPETVAEEVCEVFGFKQDEILFVSAKEGENVEAILDQIIDRVPPPQLTEGESLKSLIFDSEYDKHRGVVAFIKVVSGSIKEGQGLLMMATGKKAQALEVGHFSPGLVKDGELGPGEVGYVVTGLREVGSARVGDTITSADKPAENPLSGYKEVKPMVFASIFPESGDDYPDLRDAMEKLKLNDASLVYEPENIPSIGFGFRIGFLGLLHMDIIFERLKREFGLDLILTSPSVAYLVKKSSGAQKKIYNPSELPDQSEIEEIREPWVKLDLITPQDYMGPIMELVKQRRGTLVKTDYLGTNRLNLHFEIPLANIISDFYDKLKSVSSGYASMNYEFVEYRAGELVRLDILIAGDRVDAFSQMLHEDSAEREGREIVQRLKELIPKHQFAVALQAAVGSKIIARETIPALRKDVTAKLYGGDVTRKQKLLKKQKEGKKRMKKMGKVDIPQDTFIKLMKKS